MIPEESIRLERMELEKMFRSGLSGAGTSSGPSNSDPASILHDLANLFMPFDDSQDAATRSSKPESMIDADDLPDLISRYKVLVEQIPAIVFMAFLDRGISETYISPQIETLLGFTQEEWLEDPIRWFEHLHDEDKSRWSVEASQMFLTGDPLRSTYRVRSRDGRTVWFNCEAKMVRRKDGRPWFIHGVAFDVTELKQKEFDRQNALTMLTRNEKMLRSIFAFAPDSMIILDRSGTIERVNSRFEQMFGYEPSEIIGKKISVIANDSFYIDKNSVYLSSASSNFEKILVRRDGSEFPADIILSPLETDNGTIIITVIRDITRRKRDENSLKKLALEQSEMSRRLLNIQEAERRRIALELHDEIGQTLTGLKLALEMEARNTDKNAALFQAQGLVNDLMARVRRLSLDLRPATLDHLGLLSSLLWLFRNYSAQTNIVIDFNHQGIQSRRFSAELETSAYRIVQEALTNVARHAGVDSAKVRVWADNKTLSVSIEDNGIGFESDIVLAAGDSTGLTGMRERVSLLDGYFQVESTIGKGTKITADWFLTMEQ